MSAINVRKNFIGKEFFALILFFYHFSERSYEKN